MGRSLQVGIEEHPNPQRIDHVWITIDAGIPRRVLISINTFSGRNYDAGFDARVRVARLRRAWETLPAPVFEAHAGLDYEEIESQANVYYEFLERPALEGILLGAARTAERLEAWGESYHRQGRPGIHQIHSRRASCAVREDFRGRDGALQFYFEKDRIAELFLFKFCGQP